MATVKIAGAFVDNTTLAPKTGLTVTVSVTRNNVLTVNAAAATELNLPGVYGYDLTYDLTTDADTVWHYSFSTSSSEVTAKTVYGAFAIGKLGLERIDATVSSRLADADASTRVQTGLTAQGLTTTRAGYLDTLNNIVSNIWAAATRTITGGTVSSIPSVQSDVQSGLTAQGYTTTRAGYLDTLNGLVTNIWSHATRTVTSFGTLVSDIWAAATRTVTGIPSVQSDVQAGLTAQGYTTTRAGYLDTLDGLVADMWSYTTRTLTSSGSGGATAQEVWEYATRTVTSLPSVQSDVQAGLTAQGYTTARSAYMDVLNGLVAAVWANATRTVTSLPSVQSDVQAGLTAQGYTSTRAGYLDTLNGLVANIWAYSTRTLTSFGTLVADVWGYITRTLTSGGGGGGGATAQEIWTYATRTLTQGVVPNNQLIVPGTLEVRQGDDYKAVDGRDLRVVLKSPGFTLVGADVRFKVGNLITAGSAEQSGSDWILKVELTGVQTTALSPGAQRYEFEVTLASGSIVTPATGILRVLNQN